MSPYGFFDDDAQEYVITRPDTPLPWLNMLGQDDLYGLCTHTAGGYTFWKDAKLRRLTRYRYNDMPMDGNGRILYLCDGEDLWCPTWKPLKSELDHFECRHGLGYTRIIGRRGGIEVELLCFIPPGENLEIWKTTLRNLSGEQKNLRLFSFVEFCLFEALNDMTNFQRTYSIGEVEVEGGGIYHCSEYRERRNHYTLFGCTHPISGYDISRDAFIGVHNGLHDAAVPLAGACTNSDYCGWNPVGAHQIDITLAPGGEQSFAFLLAYIEEEEKFAQPRVINKQKGQALLAKYSDLTEVDAAFARIRSAWQTHCSVFQVDCPNVPLQRMVNTWNPAQCMATFNLSRSASMFESGIGRGMGFRDSNQDLLGFVHMIPERARQRILDIAATQLADGTCFHQYQPLTKQGNAAMGGDFYDDHLWLVLSTCAYIKESGDTSILGEAVGYADVEEKTATIRDHLELSIAYTMRNRGPHGLPLIGHADWNDCLNLNCFSTEPNESFQTAGDVDGSSAESVMIAGLFLYACRELAGLYGFLGKKDDQERLLGLHAQMLATVETEAWDGDWYRRAYDAYGKPVGSAACEEGQIYIESQGWCVLGGAGADNGRARQALASVDARLFTENGVVLQQPAYTTYHLELGEVSSYPPGFKENAGIFSHNNTWVQLGWCLLGEGDKALEYYLSICPAAKEGKIDTYRCEPYVYAQMTAGRDATTPGEAKNSWLTGTAAWSWVVATQGILGIQPDWDGLRIDPCISAAWKGFTVRRCFRGTWIDITVENPDGVCKGLRSLTLNGEPVEGQLLPLKKLKAENTVRAVMG